MEFYKTEYFMPMHERWSIVFVIFVRSGAKKVHWLFKVLSGANVDVICLISSGLKCCSYN